MDCKKALKLRGTNPVCHPVMSKVIRCDGPKDIYCVQSGNHQEYLCHTQLPVENEHDFWSSLSSANNGPRYLNISLLPEESLFMQKSLDRRFLLHDLTSQSLLRLGGRKVIKHLQPCLRRAHGPGAIFPLASAQQKLFSIDYHHQGGNRHWYIIPNSERAVVQKILDEQHAPFDLDHGQLFINPSVLDDMRVRYHRTIQRPGEFLVLSAGSLAQSFSEDASWNEVVLFALPSWINDGYAKLPFFRCQCTTHERTLSNAIDIGLFRSASIRKYVSKYLKTNKNRPSATTGWFFSLQIFFLTFSCMTFQVTTTQIGTWRTHEIMLKPLYRTVRFSRDKGEDDRVAGTENRISFQTELFVSSL